MTTHPPDQQRVVVVPPEDEIDHGNCHTLEAALLDLDPATEVVVDMASVRFCDSSGLRVLLTACQRQIAAGGSLRVVNPRPPLRRLLEITDLEHALLGDGPGDPPG